MISRPGGRYSQRRPLKKKQEKALKDLARRIEARASGGDITGAEEELRQGLQALQQGKGIEVPAPYLLGELITDIEGTVEGLKTGYEGLDKIISIPQGAITIIGARPGHGKTTLQLNLLLNMLRAHPDKRFFFFSYEEAKKFIALKLIMNLAGVELNQEANLGAYVNYFKEKRDQDFQDPDYQKIETGIQEYEELVNSGRLIVSDRTIPGEELASLVGHLARPGEVGAIFIDYIQKIPLKTPTGGQRYQEIKRVSELLLEQAKTLDIPIIMGAQLTRPASKDKGSSKSDRIVRLENLRESVDIEQDANLVLGLYNESVAKMEEEDK
jgi:replicative DNA helicase